MHEPRIYAIDDEPAVLSVVERLLSAGGYSVTTFQTAQEALKSLRATTLGGESVDMILLDALLGAESSMSATQFLECLVGENTKCEIVVMSGRTSGSGLFEWVFRGASNFLTKPFSARELLSVARLHSSIGRNRIAFSSSPWATIRRTQRDVFLCYASADRQWALGLKRLIERTGMSVWYAEADAMEGSPWRDEVFVKAFESCRVFLAALSPAALASRNVAGQVKRALKRREAQPYDYLVKAVLRGVAPAGLPEPFKAIPSIDFSDGNAAVDRFLSLVTALQSFLQRPVTMSPLDMVTPEDV
jgi:DNA-binding response OmpR family regulator